MFTEVNITVDGIQNHFLSAAVHGKLAQLMAQYTHSFNVLVWFGCFLALDIEVVVNIPVYGADAEGCFFA